jgi:hypothetical protein
MRSTVESVFISELMYYDLTKSTQLLVAFTKKYNLQYSEAENGLEALRAYQSATVQFDVILMGRFQPQLNVMLNI